MKNILAVVLALAALAIIAWFFMKPSPAAAPASAIGTSAGAGEAAKAGVPAVVGKTNPFQSDVNPVSGYQNPFAK